MAASLMSTRVAPEWVDYNGHMNDAEYARVFSLAVEALMDRIGLDAAGRAATGVTVYTLETHLCYLGQAYEGQALTVVVDVLDRDAKRLHVFFGLQNEQGETLATGEQMLMAMGVDSDRPAALPAVTRQPLAALGVLARAPWPAQAGRQIGIRRG